MTQTFALGSTIMADGSTGSRDCAGAMQSSGYNVIQTNDSCATTATNITASGPQLLPLGINGYPNAPQTHALQSGSPAIDTIAVGVGGCGTVATDQRGMARPQGPNCDSDAFEFRSGMLLSIVRKTSRSR